MSFHPFNEVAQEVILSTALNPLRLRLRRPIGAAPLTLWPSQATTPRGNLNQPVPHYFS